MGCRDKRGRGDLGCRGGGGCQFDPRNTLRGLACRHVVTFVIYICNLLIYRCNFRRKEQRIVYRCNQAPAPPDTTSAHKQWRRGACHAPSPRGRWAGRARGRAKDRHPAHHDLRPAGGVARGISSGAGGMRDGRGGRGGGFTWSVFCSMAYAMGGV